MMDAKPSPEGQIADQDAFAYWLEAKTAPTQELIQV